MKKNLINSLGLLAALAVMTACGGGTKKPAEETKEKEEESKVVKVKTSVAVIEEVEDTGVFSSNIEAFQQNNIAPQTPGRIDRILVEVGAQVSKGQLLATMDPTTYNAAAVQLVNAEADYERTKKVYAAGGISKQQLDQLETALTVSRAQVANLRENMELRSPIRGVVTARNYDPGDLFNGQVPILTVMQINTLKVALSISEKYFPVVKNGMQAEVRVDMYPDKVYQGNVSLVYPAIDPATRTFTIEVTIPNQSGELRPGMFSRTELRFGTHPGIMVEDVAIQRQLGTNDKYVFVDVDGAAERRVVTTGIQIGNRVNVLSGVEPGEKIVVAGISRLMQGTQVEEE